MPLPVFLTLFFRYRSEGRSCHPDLSEGGAFQVSLSQLQLDFYPYHLAAGNRSAWIRYHESVHSTWLGNSVQQFQADLLDALLNGGAARANHSPLARAAPGSKPHPVSRHGHIMMDYA